MTRAPIPVRIAGTGSFQPGPAYRTVDLAARVTPPRDPAEVVVRTGIQSRHFAPPRVRAVDLAAEALTAALAAAGLRPEALRRLFFVSSVGGDQIAPANANLIAAQLGLAGSCDAFDLNNACMGFLTALDLGARSVATGSGPVGIVAVELLSRYTTPDDPRPYLVLADAVAAAVLEPARAGEGVLASWLRNDGMAGGDIVLANAGLTGRRETFQFASSNRQIHEHAVTAIRRSAAAVLSEAGIGLDAVQWVLPHQPNGSMLAAIMRELALDPSRVVQIVDEIGSVGSASIATSLDRLLRSGRVRPGDHLLMVGVGAGISYGAMLLRMGS
jgi:3-oxoacyl-(acyl-carrier-protein) synthase III